MSPRFKLFFTRVISSLIVLFLIVACSLSTSNNTPPAPDKSLTLQPTLLPNNTPTSTPLPEYTEYESPSVVFSLDKANTIPPEDVLSEVTYHEGGGGVGSLGDCYNTGPEYPVAAFYNQKVVEDTAVLLEPLNLIVCGWTPEEKVEVNIKAPDGNITVAHLTAKHDTVESLDGDTYPIEQTQYVYYPSINSVEGKYIFTFAGDKDDVVKYTINYLQPTSPMAYVISYGEPDSEENQITTNIDLSMLMGNFPFVVLAGYPPQERVRLFTYSYGLFYGWQDYQVNENGRLLIQVKDILDLVVIGGDPAVEIHPAYYPFNFVYVNRFDYDGDGKLDPIYLTCEDTVPTRLKVGKYAYVATDTPTSNRLRSEPMTSAKLLRKLAPGTMMEIIDGPACADGILWWKVKGVDQEFEGWTGEGDTRYWLHPCSSKDYCQ